MRTFSWASHPRLACRSDPEVVSRRFVVVALALSIAVGAVVGVVLGLGRGPERDPIPPIVLVPEERP